MLPLQQAYEVKHSITEYLKATFSFKDKQLHEAFYDFIGNKENGIFKGPYISLKLPFVTTKLSVEIPLDIQPNFPPYDHQFKSFQRLTTVNGHEPQSTLITTGTSSGKTECFLYPILDYCYKNLERRGIKVIILYPMNALATDQAKRLAEAIWVDNRLKGKISAGLFIGEGKDKENFHKDMGENHIIEDRQLILDSPPDILLTNFKMLDYALMRHNYHKIWQFNLDDSSLLQYLVLDELHTYDGAQGTDVANLLRRLKLKLNIPKGQICAVGTSATIGSGDESKQLLTKYAEKVFGETFLEDSIIVENRETVDVFFNNNDEDLDRFLPRPIGLIESKLKENESYNNYIRRQKRLWQLPETIDNITLGEELKKLKLVKDLISLTSAHVRELNELIYELADLNQDFKRLPEWDEHHAINPREEVISSILALISEAKTKGSETLKFPFLYLQIQIWIRELSGVLREVRDTPNFTWKDKVGDKRDPKALPAYFCRECGASGWLGIKNDNKNHFSSEPNQIYEYYFNKHKNIYFINTAAHRPIEEYEPTTEINDFIHPIDLTLYNTEENDTFQINAVRKLATNETKSRHICPECNTENTLAIIGTRIATLSSITVSQIISSDLDPRTEKYRKILAFTNSVQDAAHQAGFVEARNYRFTFRSSLQRVINNNNDLIKLNELSDAFITYWKVNSDTTHRNNEKAFYYRFFPDDYKAKADINTDYRIGGNFTNDFKKEFDIRMSWEVFSEFGFNSLIGRTLEKTGASAPMFDEKQLAIVYAQMKNWVDENNLFGIKEIDFLQFLNGILHRVRTRGGIDHEYLSKFRKNTLILFDLNWNRDSRHFLNKYIGTNSRMPKLVTTQAHSRGILDSTFTNKNNWYREYYIKNFKDASNYHGIVNEFYQKLFETFVNVGLMNKAGNDANENFALSPESIIIENKVKHYICNSCGSILNIAATDTLTSGTKCLDYTCKTGFYELETNYKPNYYQLVYNRTHSPRIYAAEHTGILERKDRENKEIDFKERPNFNSLNALVATSTLEMGIDIGTLNTAINNSVPPLTSNFLQRVGRAGRSSGSALITNFAQSKAHDLFYFEEPLDMMEGEISTPGCYLEAKEILYRHFFAYCLDNWTTENPQQNIIPAQIWSLRLLNTDLSSLDFFGSRIISFIKSNEHRLLTRFINFYKEDLDDDNVLENLRGYLITETLYLRISNVFSRLKDEYQYIHNKRKEIDSIIREKKLPETDIERKELESEKKALWGIKRIIDRRSILEHLTNIGLLPNYAFPETGATLNAWVRSGKAKESNNLPHDKQFEIVRSSSTALREFAPDNYFYSQGHKLFISGLNTFDWRDPEVLIKKRFCSNCDHLSDSPLTNEPVCPNCGDSSWSSSKNQHVFLKINTVKSVNTRESSTLDDNRDERELVRYNLSRHIKFDYNSFQGAWGMRDIPFGIEYVKNVDIIEVNLGLSSSVDANKITINKLTDVPYHGFVTCRYCGKSTSAPHLTASTDSLSFHFGYCKNREKNYQGRSDEFFEEVFLFREIKTEALKVLLPIQELESESQINMFKAGLELGLKKYYKGNPSHLTMINHSEFNKQNGRFDRYLVIYDNIPGGTGYLEKLFNPDDFTDVIKKAFHSIKECGCQFNGKDGCYRCIYTYSNQYIQDELSRSSAETLFKKIVEKSNSWEDYKTGLGSLSGNGQIEESELEERFIRSLRNYTIKKNSKGFQFEDSMEDGVVNYKLKVSNGDYSFYYMIRPQYNLGLIEGVKYSTRSDFFISLITLEQNGVEIKDEMVLSFVKKIAVYLDGYTFHATKENLRFFNDLQKRLAIVEAGDKISWTLSWDDIERFDKIEKDDARDSLYLDRNKFKDTIKKYESIPYWATYKSDLLDKNNSLERLIWLLENPIELYRPNEKIALFLSLHQSNFAKPSIDEEKIDAVLTTIPFNLSSTTIAQNLSKGNFYIFPEIKHQSEFAELHIAVKLANLQSKAVVRVIEICDDLDKNKWESFWHLFNLIQSSILTTPQTLIDEIEITSMDHNPYECLDYYNSDLHEIVKTLIDNNIPFNKDGGFFIEFDGKYAEAMLGFENKKIFIRPLSDEDKILFEQAGYTEIQPEKFNIKDLA